MLQASKTQDIANGDIQNKVYLKAFRMTALTTLYHWCGVRTNIEEISTQVGSSGKGQSNNNNNNNTSSTQKKILNFRTHVVSHYKWQQMTNQ